MFEFIREDSWSIEELESLITLTIAVFFIMVTNVFTIVAAPEIPEIKLNMFPVIEEVTQENVAITMGNVAFTMVNPVASGGTYVLAKNINFLRENVIKYDKPKTGESTI